MPQIAATNDSGILQHAVCDMMIVYVLNKKRNSMEPVLFQRVFIYHKHSTPNIRQQPKYQIKHDTPLERVWGGGFRSQSPDRERESPIDSPYSKDLGSNPYTSGCRQTTRPTGVRGLRRVRWRQSVQRGSSFVTLPAT